MATQAHESVRVAGYSVAQARSATVRIETDGAVYVGRVFITDSGKQVTDVLCDDRPFINLTDVSIDGAEVSEPFVAVNKHYVRTVRILHEDGAEAVSADGRHDVVPFR